MQVAVSNRIYEKISLELIVFQAWLSASSQSLVTVASCVHRSFAEALSGTDARGRQPAATNHLILFLLLPICSPLLLIECAGGS